jgi:hypothetical protein
VVEQIPPRRRHAQAETIAVEAEIVTAVLLGSLQEREALDRSGQSAREKINQWQAENPEEAKKLAATVKRKEAARQKTQASRSRSSRPLGPTLPANEASAGKK